MKRIEILIRRLMLSFLLLFHRRIGKKALIPFSSNSKILFIRLNRIGDALVTTPLLKLIKEQIGCKIYILAGDKNYFVFENSLIADAVWIYKKKPGEIFSLIRSINKIGFDAIVDLHDDVSTTVSYLIAFTKSNYKFGLEKSNSKLFSNIITKLDPTKIHVVDRILEFKKLFNLSDNPNSTNIVFEPSKKASEYVNEFLAQHFPNKKFLLGINISAGGDARFWGIENFQKLIASIDINKIDIVLLCSEEDLTRAMDISNNMIPIYHRPTFNEFSAVIQKINLLFTPDTSVVHIASAFEKPVFGLYVKYKTTDRIWSPYKSQFDCVITEEPTLHNISYEQVRKQFQPFLNKYYDEYSNKNL